MPIIRNCNQISKRIFLEMENFLDLYENRRGNLLNKKSGFTLLELLVVVGILAALVALALPYYQDYVNQSRITAAQADLNTFAKALANYDQLEPTLFPALSTDLRSLIGKYLQDYRSTTGQVNPKDPWGNDYTVRPPAGTLISRGPDGTLNTLAAARVANGDDIVVTWKPEFFVSSARALNDVTVEVQFSRKTVPTSIVGGEATVAGGAGGGVSTARSKISDTIYRFTIPAMTGAVVDRTVTMAIGVQAQDKTVGGWDNNPVTGTTGNIATFTF